MRGNENNSVGKKDRPSKLECAMRRDGVRHGREERWGERDQWKDLERDREREREREKVLRFIILYRRRQRHAVTPHLLH